MDDRRHPAALQGADLVADRTGPAWQEVIERMSGLAERVARRHGAVLLDLRSHPAAGDPGIYSRDLLHLNARGHALVAAEVVRALAGEQTELPDAAPGRPDPAPDRPVAPPELRDAA